MSKGLRANWAHLVHLVHWQDFKITKGTKYELLECN